MRIQFLKRAFLYPASDRWNVDLSWSFLSVPPGSGTQPSALLGSPIAPVGVILKKQQIKSLFLSFALKLLLEKTFLDESGPEQQPCGAWTPHTRLRDWGVRISAASTG